MSAPPVYDIRPLDRALAEPLQRAIDGKTKPPGALGRLEALALQLGLIQQTLAPQLRKPAMLVFAGDHGITAAGVSPYPQQVTSQMVQNFLAGGAAINVFARQHGLQLRVVDAGVNAEFAPQAGLVQAKVAAGTANFLHAPAMSAAECQAALIAGAELARECAAEGSNVLGFGEMGIGNTTAAAAIMSVLCQLPPAQCVGRGTGLDAVGVARKAELIARAQAAHAVGHDEPLRALATFGGFEIAMMAGAMLAAAEQRCVLLVDGFIATSAALVAARLHPALLEYCVFCHCSGEAGHRRLLDILGAEPLLDLGMRLGEGTGAALAYPLLQSATAFLNEMASFESAGVSQRSGEA